MLLPGRVDDPDRRLPVVAGAGHLAPVEKGDWLRGTRQNLREPVMSRVACPLFQRAYRRIAAVLTSRSTPERESFMRRMFSISVPALVVCLIAGNMALAQGPGGPRGRGGRGGFGGFGGGQMPLTFLLQNPQVQKELKLADDQIAKIKEISDAPVRSAGVPATNFRDMTEEQRKAFGEEMRKRVRKPRKP